MRGWPLLLALVAGACSRGPTPPAVVLYSSIDESYTREVSRAFEKESGIRVEVVTDSEAAKSTGLLQRLLAEKEHPVADVFWSGDLMRALRLRRAGLAEPLPAAGVTGSPAAAGFSMGPSRLRLIAFNTRLANREAAPPRVADLALPGVADHSCLANPLFGSTSMHAALLLQLWGRAKAEQFLRDFTAHGGKVLASNGEVKRRVADGEFLYGLTDSDDIATAMADGKSLGFLVPDQGSADSGAVVIPSAAVLVRGAPQRAAGERLALFIARADVQQLLADSSAAYFPSNSGAKANQALHLDLSTLKLAAPITEQTIPEFEAWAGTFLEPWLEGQFR